MASYPGSNGRSQRLGLPAPPLVFTPPSGHIAHQDQDADNSSTPADDWLIVEKSNINFGGVHNPFHRKESVNVLNMFPDEEMLKVQLSIEGSPSFKITLKTTDGGDDLLVKDRLITLDRTLHTIHITYEPSKLSSGFEEAKLVLHPLSSQSDESYAVALSGYAGSSILKLRLRAAIPSQSLRYDSHILEVQNEGLGDAYVVVEVFRKYEGRDIQLGLEEASIAPSRFLCQHGAFEMIDIKILGGGNCFAKVSWGDDVLRLRWKSHVEMGMGDQRWKNSSFPFLFDTATNGINPALLMTPQEDMDRFLDTMQVSIVSLKRNCLNQFSISHPETRNVLGRLAVSEDLSRLRSNSAPNSSPIKCRYGCKLSFQFQSTANAHYLYNCPNHPLTPKPYKR